MEVFAAWFISMAVKEKIQLSVQPLQTNAMYISSVYFNTSQGFIFFYLFWQDEEGVNGDVPLDVSELSTNFEIKPKPSENAAGIALIAVSILYFPVLFLLNCYIGDQVTIIQK